MPAWDEVATRLADVLGEPVSGGGPITPGWSSRTTWAAQGQRSGPLVVKARHGDRAYEKTAWSAARLPLLAARGYPVPAIIWHGMIGDEWHITVQRRLPGSSPPLAALDGPLLDQLLDLVERQADAAIPADDRDFTGYIANVLFDDWDEIWTDADRACDAAGPLCARIRRWLEPVWGLRLPPVDFAHNDLNLSNILTDGEKITGVVDWDEFGLGSRALDLVVLALDCQGGGRPAAAGRLLASAASAAGRAGLRCLVSYRALATLAENLRQGQSPEADIQAISAVLDRLRAPVS
ncbi:MAG TPA: aminoglycoside phosphotransferase family protein [Streptosporangiaceae bacterium]|nr:aminoglycoside phosphotransferase family protein [Streptosporangiaceae bacterium]